MSVQARGAVVAAVVAVALAGGGFAAVAATAITPKRVLGKGLRVGCENSERGVELYVRPRRCVMYDPTMTFARSVDLHRLRWSRWTSDGAAGTGTECGFRRDCDNVEVRVTLSRLRRVGCGRNDYRSFTRATVTSTFGTTRVRPQICPQDEG